MGTGVAIMAGGDQLPEPNRVEVFERAGSPTAFRVRLPVDIEAGDLPRLVDGNLGPGKELTLLETVGDEPVALVKGPVCGQVIHLEHGGYGSWVEVNGSDTSITLDRAWVQKVYTDVTDSDAATTILQDKGYTPDVQSTASRHLEKVHNLVQNETNYHFVRRLARRNGCLFWITCDALGVETAHFRRPQLDGEPAAELLLNVAGANVNTVDIAWDVERPNAVIGGGLGLTDLSVLDGSAALTPQTLLGSSGLQAVSGEARATLLRAPADDAGDLQSRAEGLLIESDWFIRLSCSTSLYALGKLVRAHTLVTVNGIGTRHSGKYFVAAVRHDIDGSAHTMDLTLVRNAWG